MSSKISQLASGNPAQSSDLLPIARSGANYSITPGSIAILAQPNATDTGISGFFGGPAANCPTLVVGQAAGWSATAGYFWVFYLPYAITISKATINVSAVSASSSKQFSAGIYPAVAGSTALVKAAFNVSSGQATGARGATFSQVTLPAGWYYFVTTMNATDIGVTWFNTGSDNLFPMINANGVRAGSVTIGTPGTIDTTLGTLTASNAPNGAGICCFFE